MSTEQDMLGNFFNNLEKQIPKGNTDHSGIREIDLCNKHNRNGQLFVRLLKDKEGMPLRFLSSVRERYITTQNDEGKWENYVKARITSESNFSGPLSSSQSKLLQEIDESFNKLNEFEDGYTNERKQVYMFYGKSHVLVNTVSGERLYPGEFHLFTHYSQRFYPAWQDAIKAQSNMTGNTMWLNNFYKNEVGPSPYVAIISTGQADIGYTVAVSFNNYPDQPISLTDKDVNEIGLLRDEFIKSSFDEEWYSTVLDLCTKRIKFLSGGSMHGVAPHIPTGESMATPQSPQPQAVPYTQPPIPPSNPPISQPTSLPGMPPIN